MYEVRHRSVWEHETFSLTVERRNLKQLHEANTDFIHELQRINYLDQLAYTSRLNGKVFKKKLMDEDKLKGLVSLSAGIYGYFKLPALSLMLGTSLLPSAAVAGGLLWGVSQFAERMCVKEIEALDDGKIKITYLETPFRSKSVEVKISDCYSICALGDDDMGADDVDENLLAV